MKNLIAALVIIVTVQISAQDFTMRQSGSHVLNQFYVDLISKAASVNGDWGLLGGLRAGYNLNENISVGLVGHGLIPEKLGGSYINRDNRDELHLGYGGAELIYRYSISERFYLTGNMMIGAGRVDYEIADGNDYFFVAEPGASVNLRITDWFGIGYSANYRIASGVKYADFSNASFSGWSANFDLKFGF